MTKKFKDANYNITGSLPDVNGDWVDFGWWTAKSAASFRIDSWNRQNGQCAIAWKASGYLAADQY